MVRKARNQLQHGQKGKEPVANWSEIQGTSGATWNGALGKNCAGAKNYWGDMKAVDCSRFNSWDKLKTERDGETGGIYIYIYIYIYI